MPASASSLISAVCTQLATLAVADPVAALPGLLDVVAGVTDPRSRRDVRHDPGRVDLRGDRGRPLTGRGMGG
jgi:hypothetical protein